jgi:hypothetical protein
LGYIFAGNDLKDMGDRDAYPGEHNWDGTGDLDPHLGDNRASISGYSFTLLNGRLVGSFHRKNAKSSTD